MLPVHGRGESAEIDLARHRDDGDGQVAVDIHHQSLEHLLRVETEHARRLLAEVVVRGIVVVGVLREGDARSLQRRGRGGTWH